MRKHLFFFSIILAFLGTSCTKVIHTVSQDVQVYQIQDSTNQIQVADIAELIEPYKKQLDGAMNLVIGNCPKKLEKGAPQSTLGNWMADAIYTQSQQYFDSKIDFAIQNQGGIRVAYLPKGDITKGNIFELMPFENRVVLLKMNGNMIDTFFNHITMLGGWPMSQQVQYKKVGGTAQKITINGEPLDVNTSYTFVLPDYIANGGDNCSFLSNYIERIDSEILIRDLLMDYIQTNPSIEGTIDNRITPTNN